MLFSRAGNCCNGPFRRLGSFHGGEHELTSHHCCRRKKKKNKNEGDEEDELHNTVVSLERAEQLREVEREAEKLREALSSLEKEFNLPDGALGVDISVLRKGEDHQLFVECRKCLASKDEKEKAEKDAETEKEISGRKSLLLALKARAIAENMAGAGLLDVVVDAKTAKFRCAGCNGSFLSTGRVRKRPIATHMESAGHKNAVVADKVSRELSGPIDVVIAEWMAKTTDHRSLTHDVLKFRVELASALLSSGIALNKMDCEPWQVFFRRYTSFQSGGRKGLERVEPILRILENRRVKDFVQGSGADLCLISDGGDIAGKKCEGFLVRKITGDGAIHTKMIACKVMHAACKSKDYFQLVVQVFTAVGLDQARLCFALTDSLRSNVAGLKMLKDSGSDERSRLEVIACISHFFNNAGNKFKGMKVLEKFLSTLSALFSQSKKARSIWNDIVELKILKTEGTITGSELWGPLAAIFSKTLPQFSATRWFGWLDSALLISMNISRVAVPVKVKDKDGDWVMIEEEVVSASGTPNKHFFFFFFPQTLTMTLGT